MLLVDGIEPLPDILRLHSDFVRDRDGWISTVQLRQVEDCKRVREGDLEPSKRVSRHDASKLARDKKESSR